ncbi:MULTISPECIES: ABC transporter permease [Bacillaceae]|uniref:ABC transporter permease n=1 Tax=Bacillaceae TaxID=186817 RepID=UPI001C590559|nr:ABC transporter permease [Rossellomorea sp. YZS02]MBW3110665.1 ABC transporter permease [Bacillus sp. MCCB 382]MDX8343357.1 ABC transporter permease [Rossellomorea sp. YZS02]
MRTWISKGWRPFLVLILLFIIWEVSIRVFEVPAWLMPPPSDIWAEGIASWPVFKGHLASTTTLTIAGFVIGCSIGIGTAVGLHLLPKVKEAIYPLMILSQNIPIIVLAPLLVIWFGFGLLPKIIVITLICFFPVAVSALDGFRQTNAEYILYMKMSGASKGQIFRKVEWPHALPSIFSGLKISATYSVMGAVISEWLGAQKGIGVYMTLASSSFRTDRVFVAIFMIMLLSLVFFGIILLLEKFMVKWNRKEDK